MAHNDFDRALEIVREELYDGSKDDPGYPIFAQIHHALKSNLQEGGHNCLGCNLSEATNGIDYTLSKIVTADARLEFEYPEYLWWLYLFVERADTLFDIIGLPQPYRRRHFDVFVTIRRWTNFLKHPGYFILVHHPSFFADGDDDFIEANYDFVIKTAFVRANYGAEAKSRKNAVRSKLENRKNIAVLYPNIVDLTENFCSAVRKMLDLIENNAVFREILSERSTIDDYFSDSE